MGSRIRIDYHKYVLMTVKSYTEDYARLIPIWYVSFFVRHVNPYIILSCYRNVFSLHDV